MLREAPDSPRVRAVVDHFSNYDLHKSHGRSIDHAKCVELGLAIVDLQTNPELRTLVRSLANQYELFFDKSAFFKLYENSRGINWGRQQFQIQIPVSTGPPPPGSQPAKAN